MFIQKHLPMLGLILLLSNVLMQGMDITVENTAHGTSTSTKLKKYDEFVNSLNDKKYQSGQLLEELIEMSASDDDHRYFKKLIEHNEIYAKAIKSKGLAIYKHYVINKHAKNVKLLLAMDTDVDKIVRKEDDDNKTLLSLAVGGCCFGGGMFTIKETDKIVKLLIKRGANVAIKFLGHPTLLEGLKSQIENCSKASESAERKKKIIEMKKVENVLINASQIHADYLKKKAIKAEINREQENLKRINGDQVAIIKGRNFDLHMPIVSARCPALLNL